MTTYGLIQEVWEGEEPEGVPCGGGVKNNVLEVRVLWALQELNHLADGHCFVYARWQRVQQLTCAHNYVTDNNVN